jgi:hypothetical protein
LQFIHRGWLAVSESRYRFAQVTQHVYAHSGHCVVLLGVVGAQQTAHSTAARLFLLGILERF